MRYKPNCKTCQLSKGNEKLRTRILKAKFRREPGDETMSQIAEQLGVSWAAYQNHCNKHISDRSEGVVQKQTAKAVAKVHAHEMKELEVAFDHKDVIPEMDYERATREIIALGLQRLANENITVSTTQLLQAIKIKADYSAKKRGQDTEMIKTMYRFASGQKEEPNKQEGNKDGTVPVTTGPPESAPAGAIRPRDLYREAAWDALTRRPEEVPAGDTPAPSSN